MKPTNHLTKSKIRKNMVIILLNYDVTFLLHIAIKLTEMIRDVYLFINNRSIKLTITYN